MTLWCIFRSPLMFGGHLPETDLFTQQLITNDEALAVNRNSSNNRELKTTDGLIVWSADVPGSSNKYLAFFNTTDQGPREIRISWSELGLPDGEYPVRDLWAKANLGRRAKVLAVDINAHGAGLYRIEAR